METAFRAETLHSGPNATSAREPPFPESTIGLFWAKTDIRTDNECWNWQASTLRKGYGRFSVRKVLVQAHRFSWMLANGRGIPAGLQVLHSCDNPRCVNPNHLSIGTNGDNVRDCVAKGRHRTRSSPKK